MIVPQFFLAIFPLTDTFLISPPMTINNADKLYIYLNETVENC